MSSVDSMCNGCDFAGTENNIYLKNWNEQDISLGSLAELVKGLVDIA